jgi:hypothetical protein
MHKLEDMGVHVIAQKIQNSLLVSCVHGYQEGEEGKQSICFPSWIFVKESKFEERKKYTEYYYQQSKLFKKNILISEYPRVISKTSFKWLKHNFVSKFSGFLSLKNYLSPKKRIPGSTNGSIMEGLTDCSQSVELCAKYIYQWTERMVLERFLFKNCAKHGLNMIGNSYYTSDSMFWISTSHISVFPREMYVFFKSSLSINPSLFRSNK